MSGFDLPPLAAQDNVKFSQRRQDGSSTVAAGDAAASAMLYAQQRQPSTQGPGLATAPLPVGAGLPSAIDPFWVISRPQPPSQRGTMSTPSRGEVTQVDVAGAAAVVYVR